MRSLKCSCPSFTDVVLGSLLGQFPSPQGFGGSPMSVPHMWHFCDVCALLGTSVSAGGVLQVSGVERMRLSFPRNEIQTQDIRAVSFGGQGVTGLGTAASSLPGPSLYPGHWVERGYHPHSILRSRNSKKSVPLSPWNHRW